jgi:hypothetical protein
MYFRILDISLPLGIICVFGILKKQGLKAFPLSALVV